MGRSALIPGLPQESHAAKRDSLNLERVPYASLANLHTILYSTKYHIENLDLLQYKALILSLLNY